MGNTIEFEYYKLRALVGFDFRNIIWQDLRSDLSRHDLHQSLTSKSCVGQPPSVLFCLGVGS